MMQKLRYHLPVLLLFSICLYSNSCTQPVTPKAKQSFTKTRTFELDAFINTYMHRFPVPGLAVSMVSNDSVYFMAQGIANSANKEFTANTSFMAGSISEPMLATAVLKLADEGRLDIDAPVTNYLPYFKMSGESYKQVTIRHLLTHTSGIQHYNMMWDMPNFKPDALEITTRSISTQQPEFKVPGSKVKRSPYNYDILADVIDKVTGKPFEVYVKQHVFNKLGMYKSAFNKPAQAAMPFRISNWLAYTTTQDTLYPYNRENGGSGGFHTTAVDMAAWMFTMLNKAEANKPQFAGAGFFERVFSLQFKTGKHTAIGFGWEIKEEAGQKVYYKSSSYGGFSNQIILIPGKKIGVSVTSNMMSDDNPANICGLIARWLSKQQRLQTPKIPVSMPMSRMLAKTGRMNAAFEVYRTLQQQKPQQYDFSPAVLSQFGINLLHRVHDKQKALQAFKFCVTQNPQSAYAYLNLAEGYIFVKDAKNTRMAINKAILLPDDSGVKNAYLSYLKENLEILEEKKG